jgi:sec-independent protein translocase protein TatC
MARLPRLRPPRRLAHGEEASLVEHLDELRQRLFVCIGALVVGAVIGFTIHSHLIHWLQLTLPTKYRGHLTVLSPFESFTTVLWISIYFGVILALPVILWQTWSFFVPAVNDMHVKMMKWFVLFATILAVCGIAFGYVIVLPAAERFLTNFDTVQLHYIPQAKPFFSFCVNIMLAMALVFELPVFVIGLTQLGIMETRTLRKNRRIGYFVCIVLGLCLPGVDLVSTFFEVAPLVVLYEVSIWVAVILERRSQKRLQTALEA